MTQLNITNINLKIACALLKANKKLSLNEIKALPNVDDESADIIKSSLLKIFNADLVIRKRENSIIPDWEEVIYLKE